jgi:hypothetical protein
LPSFKRGVVGFGIAVVGVDEAGEDHPHRDREVESRRCRCDSTQELVVQAVQLDRDLAPPGAIEPAAKTLDPRLQGGLAAARLVRQARMVAEDAVGERLGRDAVLAQRLAEHDRPARRGMIDGNGGAGEPPLEIRVVLAEIVQEPGAIGSPFQAERPGAGPGDAGDRPEMLGQTLPVVLRRVAAGVRPKRLRHSSLNAMPTKSR